MQVNIWNVWILEMVYDQYHDCESLISDLASLLDTEQHFLTVIPFACEESPIEWFKADGYKRTIEKLKTNDGVVLFRLIFHPLKNEVDPISRTG
jgi:hypothetical protein